MRISEILHRKGGHVVKITTVDPIAKAVQRLAAERIGALVVVDRWDALAGMLSERDIVRALAQHGAAALACEVHELMTPEVTTCGPGDRVDAVMAVMNAHRCRHLPVMEGGKLVGLVSIGDCVLAKLLEAEQEASVLRDLNRAWVPG
jgi:CBS domain-containing protein